MLLTTFHLVEVSTMAEVMRTAGLIAACHIDIKMVLLSYHSSHKQKEKAQLKGEKENFTRITKT